MTTIYYIRHGQTDWNLSGRLQGQTDIPLNEQGRLQARESASLLKGVHLDAILASPLTRARQTAREIADALDPSLPILTLDGLKERCFGHLEGCRIDAAVRTALWDFHSPLNQRETEGIETLDRFCMRVNACLDGLLASYAGKPVLIVAHGGVAVPVRLRFEGAPSDTPVYNLIPSNACLLRYAVPPPARASSSGA